MENPNNTSMIYLYSFELQSVKYKPNGYENRSKIDNYALEFQTNNFGEINSNFSKSNPILDKLTLEELQNPLINVDTDGIERLIHDMKCKLIID